MLDIHGWWAAGAVHVAAELSDRAGKDIVGPAMQIGVALHSKECAQMIGFAQDQIAISRPSQNVR